MKIFFAAPAHGFQNHFVPKIEDDGFEENMEFAGKIPFGKAEDEEEDDQYERSGPHAKQVFGDRKLKGPDRNERCDAVIQNVVL